MRPCRHEDRSCDAPIGWEGQSLDKLLVRHDSIIAGRQHAIDSLQQKRMNEGHCFVARSHSHWVIIPSPIGSEWESIRSHSDVAGIRLIACGVIVPADGIGRHHLNRTETLVRRRFTGSSRTSKRSPLHKDMGCGTQRTIGAIKFDADRFRSPYCRVPACPCSDALSASRKRLNEIERHKLSDTYASSTPAEIVRMFFPDAIIPLRRQGSPFAFVESRKMTPAINDPQDSPLQR
jgi:hypothetical protein